MRPLPVVKPLKLASPLDNLELKQMCVQLEARVLDPPELMYERPMRPPPV